jgi:NAD+ kinase
MIKFFFAFDKTIKAQKIKKKYLSRYRNHKIDSSDVIIVGGGDGFMLHTIKQYYKHNKPFYGINCGTVGFLLNKHKRNNLKKSVMNAKKILIKPLDILITTKNKKYKLMAINEISLLRQSKQTAQLKIFVNKKKLINKIIGDGVLVSTPAGSTAYNLSVNGPILSLNSKKIAITPISPFRPRRWKGKIVSDENEIKIINLDPDKRPIASLADSIEKRNIRTAKVTINKKITICLLYDKNKSLDERIKFEQIKRKKNV